MFKLLYISLFLSLSANCYSQAPAKAAVNSSYRGILITQNTISKSAGNSEKSTIRYLYLNNSSGDSLAVYVIDQGSLSAATAYTISNFKTGCYLKMQPLNNDQDNADSLSITFNDAAHCVIIKNDTYTLYQPFYKTFKQQVQAKHSVAAVLNLLKDNIGDYNLDYLMPLLFYTSYTANDKAIDKAKIVTTRSQAEDMKDTWNCIFQYNAKGKLDKVKVSSGKDIRYSKQVTYTANNVALIKYYKDIEDRQVTNGTIIYSLPYSATLKCTEKVDEPGKNNQTTLYTTYTRRNIVGVKRVKLQQADALKLIR